MITAMERLAAAATGAASDRIPVFCNLLDQGAQELGLSLQEYYTRGEYVAEGQLRMRTKYGYDNVWGLLYVGKEAELLGCREIVFAGDGPPNVRHMVIQTYDDIHRLKVPEDVSAHPAFEETLKCLNILRAEVGGQHPICVYLTASMTLPAILMGMEQWMKLLLSGPAEVRDELLEKCSAFFHKEFTAYRAAGADVFLYSNPFGSTDFVPMTLFESLSLPWLERDLKSIDVQGVVYYGGGARINPVIERVLERTGIGVYYPSPLEDVAEAKRILAGRALCAGVINDIRLIDWTPSEVCAEVRRLLAAGMPGGKFLFGTVLMPCSIPEENIRAMVAAACEFGRL